MRALSSFFPLLIAIILAFFSTAGAYAQQLKTPVASAEHDFRSWLQSLEAGGIKVTTGAIKVDQSNDTLMIDDLALSTDLSGTPNTNEIEIKIAKFSVSSFKIKEGGYEFDRANVSGILIGYPRGKGEPLTIATLNIGKSFLPDISGFKGDPRRPITTQINFLKLITRASLARIALSDIKIGAASQFGELIFEGVLGGSVRSIQVNAIDARLIPDGTSEYQEKTLRIDNVSLLNISIESYIDLFDESSYLAAGAARPWTDLAGSLIINGFNFKNGAVLAAFTAANLGPLKVRQFAQNITQIFDNASQDATYLEKNPVEAETLANSIRQSFALEKGSIEGLTVATSGTNKVAVKSASLANLRSNHLDRIKMNGANISDSSGNVSINTAELIDVNLAAIPEKYHGEGDSAAGIHIDALPTVGNVNITGVSAKLGEATFDLDNFALAMSYFVGATPTNIKAEINHVKLPVAQIPDLNLRKTFTDLNYENLDLSLHLSASWQDSSSEIAIDAVKFTSVNMGTLTLSGALTGITRTGIQDPTGALAGEAIAGSLQNFRLTFENDTLFERFLNQAAKANNRTVDELRKLLSANMTSIFSQISSPPIRNKFIFSAVSFINNPKIIEIAAKSSASTPISSIADALKDPNKLPVLLNLDVNAHDRK